MGDKAGALAEDEAAVEAAMKRSPLYARSGATRRSRAGGAGWAPPPLSEGVGDALPGAGRRTVVSRLKKFWQRHEKAMLFSAAVVVSVGLISSWQALQPKAKVYTQDDIDKAVAFSLKKNPQPARSAIAAASVMPSVVRVTGYDDRPADETKETSAIESPHDDAIMVGSGVVIDERGTILTNLHVAGSAPRLRVTFFNGMEVEADLVGAQPEDDLAVIRPRRLPDDLKPAALASTRGLAPGDEVVAVGFPFGIGPSVSSGVVSGLKRSWKFSEERTSDNLIQFDAAANPGNSGGPLVNKDGEVLGIVTGILNPNKQGVFIGIGFAVPIENAARAAGRSPF
jgi:serine protease DegQ